MYCTTCGKPRPDNVTACPSCGAVIHRPPPAPTVVVPNYLIQSVLVTLCCCLPFGIPAIVYAAQVNSKLAAGDIAGAREASKNARTWCWVSFGCGLLATAGYLVMVVLLHTDISLAIRFNAFFVMFAPALLVAGAGEGAGIWNQRVVNAIRQPWVSWAVVVAIIAWGVLRNTPLLNL